MSLSPDPNTIHTQLTEEESILLNLQTKQYYSLNETGRDIWAGITERRSIDEIVSRLVRDYNVRAKEARKHVDDFLLDLIKNGLVRDEAD